jgi:hypothetical protein
MKPTKPPAVTKKKIRSDTARWEIIMSHDRTSAQPHPVTFRHPRVAPRPDEPHLHLIENVSFKPIFILGEGRSGTTILYDLLSRTGRFNVVSFYHVARYHELLRNHVENRTEQAKQDLSRALEAAGLVDRKIDKFKITPDTPVEYGRLLGLAHRKINPRTLPRLLEACRKIQYISDPTKPLLLKNPRDYGANFPLVLRLFPDAMVIFNHRNPLETVNSWLKMARNTFEEKNPLSGFFEAKRYERLWGRRFNLRLSIMRFLFSETWDLGARLSARRVVSRAEYYLDHIDEVSKSRYISIRYEDLCAEPDRIIMDILGFLGLKSERPVDFADLIQFREPELLPSVARRLPQLDRKLARYCRALDYPLPSASAAAKYGGA